MSAGKTPWQWTPIGGVPPIYNLLIYIIIKKKSYSLRVSALCDKGGPIGVHSHGVLA